MTSNKASAPHHPQRIFRSFGGRGPQNGVKSVILSTGDLNLSPIVSSTDSRYGDKHETSCQTGKIFHEHGQVEDGALLGTPGNTESIVCVTMDPPPLVKSQYQCEKYDESEIIPMDLVMPSLGGGTKPYFVNGLRCLADRNILLGVSLLIPDSALIDELLGDHLNNEVGSSCQRKLSQEPGESSKVTIVKVCGLSSEKIKVENESNSPELPAKFGSHSDHKAFDSFFKDHYKTLIAPRAKYGNSSEKRVRFS